MGTSFLTQWLSEHEINNICWTLIHSLWIGMITALLAGLVITFTRKASAAMRYRLLCSILILFVVSIGITYYLEVKEIPPPPPAPLIAGGNIHIKQTDMLAINHADALVKQQGIISQAVSFLDYPGRGAVME